MIKKYSICWGYYEIRCIFEKMRIFKNRQISIIFEKSILGKMHQKIGFEVYSFIIYAQFD